MSDTAVLFIIFNRPSITQKVFDTIRRAKSSRLYIASDAPRDGNYDDEKKCNAARYITEQIDWPCRVERLYQQNNLGCGFGPRAAIDWFFAQENEGIILEDDCLPHPDFFLFASEMLEKYRLNKKIISINGSNLGYKLNDGNSYTFSRFMNMWGWATWADRAQAIEYSLNDWKKVNNPIVFLYKRMRQHIFDLDFNWYKYWQQKFDLTVSEKRITWWDWQWIWHQVLHRKLSIVPAVNLVSNIGFSAEGTHTKEVGNPAAFIPLAAITLPLHHPHKIKPNFKYEEQVLKWVWCYHKRLPWHFYPRHILKMWFSKSGG